MAIKGKGRSKRRGVAAAPKPVYVQPKRPLFARRGVWIPAVAIIVIGTVAAVVTGLLIQHHNNQQKALKAKETSIVDRFGRSVDTDLAGVGQPFQTQFQAFPALTTDVTNLTSGKLTAADAVKEGRKWSKAAADAQASIEQIPAAQMILGHPDLIDLSNAQNLVADGLGVYQQAADALKLSGKATGPLQKQLITHTQNLLAAAARVFNHGYQKLINERAKFNLLVPVNPSQQTSPPAVIPTAPVVPSAVPSAAPSSAGGSNGHKHKKK
jgi:hypothetical protein